MQKQNFDNPEFSILASILSAFLCVIFGANAVAIKMALSGVGVFTCAAIRFGIAAFAIWIWARTRGQPLAPARGRFYLLLIFAALFAVQLTIELPGANFLVFSWVSAGLLLCLQKRRA
ncbi:MAG: hypothetical protein P8X68_22645 [Desulfobacterales bacterium]